jgi:NADPH:quinone reductase
MITFGNASGPVPPFSPLILSPKSLKVCRPNSVVYLQTKEEFDHYATRLMKMLSNNELKISVSQIYDLKDAAKAQDDLQVCFQRNTANHVRDEELLGNCC